MKLVFTAGALLFASLPIASLPVAAHAASNEVPLHVEAVGEVMPDIVTIGLTQSAQGPSQAAANSALDRQHDALLTRLSAFGIGATDVVWARDAVGPADADMSLAADDAKSPPPTFSANATATVTLREITKLPALTEAMAALPEPVTINARSIRYSFANEGAARQQAIQRGFEAARRDAEAYAAAARMTIARVERISSARSPFSATDMQQFVAKFVGLIDRKTFPGDVFNSVTASVVVDYVLVP